jgi:hypothetical protein
MIDRDGAPRVAVRRTSMIKRLSAIVLATAALGLAACGDDEETTMTSASEATAEMSGAEDGSVSFVAPEDGATEGNEVTAEVELENFDLAADQVGEEAVPGQGHLHFSMDEGKYDYPKYSGKNGKLAEMLGVEGQYSPATEPTITYTGLPAGEHTLEVYLANNDHTDTGVEAATTFTVK